MPAFTPKLYQQSALDSVAVYFRKCQRMGNADYAFQETTKALWERKSDFTPLAGFPSEMPYFCLRVPTGGGKTFIAAKSVAMVNDVLLHTEHSVILWLVPSKAIRDQTMGALKNRGNPLHSALREAGPVTVMDLDEAKALNRSYAFVASKDFGETAATLRDSLVEGAGFDREEAADFVAARKTEQGSLDFKRGGKRVVFTPMTVPVSEKLDVKKLSPGLKKKVKYRAKTKELDISAPLSEEETEELQEAAVMDDTKEVLRQAGEHSRTRAVEIFTAPSERGMAFSVPQIEVLIDGELRLFDEPEALDYPWELPLYQANPTDGQLAALDEAVKVKQGGEIDIDENKGRVTTRFVDDLERDLNLAYIPENWTEAKLAAWFCRQIHDPSITHASKTAFVSHWLGRLLEREKMDLARVNRQKFLLRNLVEEQINELRREAIRAAHQAFLFGDGNEERVRVGSEYEFEFHPDAYAPDRDYDGEYGEHDFQKHYYPRMGDFDSKEEYACACWLDRQPEVKTWVRNLVRKNGASFFLQGAEKRFYPDFVCKLSDGRILVVEYKGADRWKNAEPDRKLGELWAELSDGKCAFVMVKDKKWEWIEAKFGGG